MKKKVVHLNRYHHFTELMKDPSVEVSLSRYISEYDGTRQSVMLLYPSTGKADKLFFFFHGMDGDVGDSVILRGLVKKLNAKVISMGGRGASWISDQFISDAKQITHKYGKGYKKYFFLGVSMGGTQALALPAFLPAKSRKKLAGVISLIPGVDLVSIAKRSSNARVKRTLLSSTRGGADKLGRRSPCRLINKYTKGMPFVIFYNTGDTILLSKPTEELIRKLRDTNPVSVFRVSGEHDFTYNGFDYKKIFQELGKRSEHKKAPLNFK